MSLRLAPTITMLLCLLGQTSCGGGSSSGTQPMQIIDRSGYTVGRISGFGSVIVNGVRFDTTTASILIDDEPAAESALAVGQVVVVIGSVDGDQGIAESIQTDPQVRGPVSILSTQNNQLTVLDTVVLVTPDTQWDAGISPGRIETLAVADVIEVFGFRDAAGSIRATFIRRSPDPELEVQGIVSLLNNGASFFMLGNLGIDYTGANLLGFAGEAISNGDLVEVEGVMLDAAGTLIAARVERESSADISAGVENTEVELEGLITAIPSSERMSVGTVSVLLDAQTRYEGGTVSDLQLNRLIEVEGRVDSMGSIIAREISFRVDSEFEIEATAEAISENSITLLGLSLVAVSTTALIDESDQNLQPFALTDVALGDFLKARAFAEGDTLILNRIERINPEDRLKLQGPVSDILVNQLVIQSAIVNVDQNTEYTIDGENVSQVEFFAQLRPGQVIEAAGQSPEPGVLLADEVELED